MKRILSLLGSLLFTPASLLAAERIDLRPSSGYDRSLIFLDLAFFWIALIILIALIRLKLREIERVQAMDAGQEHEKIPTLE
jgi:hypothetical protein